VVIRQHGYCISPPSSDTSIRHPPEQLLADCRRRLGDRLCGHEATIGARLARDQACFHDLPASPHDACEKRAGRVSSLSLVRYRGTDYSVPTAYGHREVLVRGYVDRVEISCGAETIARHVRSYEREDFVFDPLHYLALLEPGALDQAAPLAGADRLHRHTSILQRCAACSRRAWASKASASSCRCCG
jgi:hypothetical protein